MPLVWIGLALLIARWLEWAPVADWAWGWFLVPFAAAFVWFESLERLLGRDRRRVDDIEADKRRRRRLEESFGKQPGASRDARR